MPNDDAPHCSFCGRHQREVRRMVAGPSAFICDECVALASDVATEAVAAAEPEGAKARLRDAIDVYVAARLDAGATGDEVERELRATVASSLHAAGHLGLDAAAALALESPEAFAARIAPDANADVVAGATSESEWDENELLDHTGTWRAPKREGSALFDALRDAVSAAVTASGARWVAVVDPHGRALAGDAEAARAALAALAGAGGVAAELRTAGAASRPVARAGATLHAARAGRHGLLLAEFPAGAPARVDVAEVRGQLDAIAAAAGDAGVPVPFGELTEEDLEALFAG